MHARSPSRVRGSGSRCSARSPTPALTNSSVMTGEATVTNDRAKIKDLWTPDNKAFWDSENDPDIRLITVIPEDAEVWDSPGRLVSAVKMLTAAITGAKVELGNNRKVKL